MLRTSDLEYDLPSELLAIEAAEPRDSARMLVVRRGSDEVEHRRVRDLPEYLSPGDVMVLNTTRVIPARFVGRYADTGGRVEGLYLGNAGAPGRWRCMVRARRIRGGIGGKKQTIVFDTGVRAGIVARDTDDPTVCVLAVEDGYGDDLGVLAKIGLPPLPPYIQSARRSAGRERGHASDTERYQTVYAGAPGSVAAPTAGLHFTPELLARIENAGVRRVGVTLHVGAGTFKPVESEFVEDHPIHGEWCSMNAKSLAEVQAARAAGKQVLAVGTTSVRTIESYSKAENLCAIPPNLETRLLVTPGYQWRATTSLLTNFHLPRSTLMALVAAMLPGGVTRLLELYGLAIRERYRFYSFGDAMLILP